MTNSFHLSLARQFVIKSNGWSYIVTFDDLVYVKVCDHHCSFFFNGIEKEIKVRTAISGLQLPREFVKIRKNCIVNTKYVHAYAKAGVKVRWNDAEVSLESNVATEQFDNLFGPILNDN